MNTNIIATTVVQYDNYNCFIYFPLKKINTFLNQYIYKHAERAVCHKLSQKYICSATISISKWNNYPRHVVCPFSLICSPFHIHRLWMEHEKSIHTLPACLPKWILVHTVHIHHSIARATNSRPSLFLSQTLSTLSNLLSLAKVRQISVQDHIHRIQ